MKSTENVYSCLLGRANVARAQNSSLSHPTAVTLRLGEKNLLGFTADVGNSTPAAFPRNPRLSSLTQADFTLTKTSAAQRKDVLLAQ